MKIPLYTEVALTRDLPQEGLCRGDVATLVDYLPGTNASGGEEGCVLEVFNALGELIALVSVPASAIAPLRANEVLSVRPLARS